jgi:hypothetical protein
LTAKKQLLVGASFSGSHLNIIFLSDFFWGDIFKYIGYLHFGALPGLLNFDQSF